MANRIFQGIIRQMHEAIDRVIGVIDNSGVVVACSENSLVGESYKVAREELNITGDFLAKDGYTYRYVSCGSKPEYTVFVEGVDKAADKYSAILCISLQNIKSLYDEKFDKSSFIKNIILDNILSSDIYAKSKELQLDGMEPRVVFLIRFYSIQEGISPFDILQNMFPDKSKDYVINVGEGDILVARELDADTTTQDLEQFAQSVSDTLSSEFYCKAGIGIGSIVHNVKDLSRSYREAQIAVEVGKVFETEKEIVSYENLGIGRLIYQLPTTLCDMFLSEVFKHGSLETLDKETYQTIQVFFDNNLNVSETSRKLFVHRNTLVYRLEKIRKLTGLDLREFDHAVTFKVALMVKKYLTSKPVKF